MKLSRRVLLFCSLAVPAAGCSKPSARRRALIATDEPWATYHVAPLIPEAIRQGWDLVQLVPDRSRVGDPVPVTTVADAPPADLLVLTGAGDWPADCATRFPQLPLAASALAYHPAVEAPRAREFRARLRSITASSKAESRAFGAYLGSRNHIEIVGSIRTDRLPRYRPESNRVLVVTSVTHPDRTGSAAAGTELLLAATERLAAAGKHIEVALHPREDRRLWGRYSISESDTLTAAAHAEAAIGIPGTVFPLIAAVGTPLVGCVAPALAVPDYLRSVCSANIDNADRAVTAIDEAHRPTPEALSAAVGPIGGSARRLLNTWTTALA